LFNTKTTTQIIIKQPREIINAANIKEKYKYMHFETLPRKTNPSPPIKLLLDVEYNWNPSKRNNIQ
jgi:hypothetical protein